MTRNHSAAEDHPDHSLCRQHGGLELQFPGFGGWAQKSTNPYVHPNGYFNKRQPLCNIRLVRISDIRNREADYRDFGQKH